MIAAVRVRFTQTPASAVWNDTVFANWLNPAIQFSLANFWLQSSFTQADVTFQIFPAVVMDDPRSALSPADRNVNAKSRGALVNGVIAKVTDTFHPDWSTIDGILIWFAQPTDLFGGGTYPVMLPLADAGPLDFIFGGPEPEFKNIPSAVCDIAATFDSVCQEVGHAYGLEHPLDRAGQEYGDPYDSMASRTYGGKYSSSFQRPVDPALPVGVGAAGEDVQRSIGPYLSAAQLWYSPFAPALETAGMFIEVPPSYATGASSFTLHALDDAVAHFPARALPIAAVIPPITPGGDTYFLELRRIAGYDSGLHVDAADASDPPHPPLGVVIHSYDQVRKRVVYVDTLPLAGNRGDRDYHLFGGGAFTFRVTSIGADFRTVGVTVGGRDFWRNFGVNIEEVDTEVLVATRSDWKQAEVSPCFMFPAGTYSYYYTYSSNRTTLVVSSFGYEQPAYVWTLNGTVLDPAKNNVNISASVESPGPAGTTTATALVPLEYTVGADRLTLSCSPEIGNFSLLVEVRSVESSPGVLKNVYEDRTVVTSVRFGNVRLVWDDNYTRAQKACEDALDAVNRKHIPVRRAGIPKPEDPFRGRPIESLINELANAGADFGLGVARAVVDEVTRVGNIVREQLSRRQ